MPEPGNPQALNRYSYVLNNPLRYTDPTGMLTPNQIMDLYGVDTWAEVRALFEEGGPLAGQWGWLETLRRAELGDTIFFEDLSAADPEARVLLQGVLEYSHDSWFIRSPSGARTPAASAGNIGKSFLLLGADVQRFPAGEKFLHPGFAPDRIDRTDAAVDIGGLVGEAVRYAGPLGYLVYGASEVAEIFAWANSGRKAVYNDDWAPLTKDVVVEMIGAAADLARISPWAGYVANFLSLGINLSRGFTWGP